MSEVDAVSKKLEKATLDDQPEEQVDDLEFDPSMKKKKKKKKSKSAEEKAPEPAPTEAAPAEDEEELDFSKLKKKKKKKSKATEGEKEAEVAEAAEKEEEAEAAPVNDEEELDFSKLKKKKNKDKKNKVKFEDEAAPGGEEEGATDGTKGSAAEDTEEGWLGSDRDYTYHELLARIFKTLRQNNPELAGEKRRYTIAPPQMIRDGKKSVFANISDICRRMNRPIEHLIQFLLTELGTTGSVDGSNRLILKGRFQQRNMEQLLRRYIREYVTCKLCKSPDTTISKENRLFFMHCESCGSTRSVATIKSGFVAQTTKRSVLRRAAGQ